MNGRVRARGSTSSVSTEARRRYDGRLRRTQAAGTRERIVAAGAEILRESSIRDWESLTLRAVAARAGVNERTVYRHFASERGLRDAVMDRLEHESGIDLAGMELADVTEVAARIFAQVSAYPREARPKLDPTLSVAGQRQRKALLDAVTARTEGWPQQDRVLAAAVLDVLWSVAAYERLVGAWHLDRKEAVQGVCWLIGLVQEAVRDGRRPGVTQRTRSGRARVARRPRVAQRRL